LYDGCVAVRGDGQAKTLDRFDEGHLCDEGGASAGADQRAHEGDPVASTFPLTSRASAVTETSSTS
jgi:hypothetical protein